MFQILGIFSGIEVSMTSGIYSVVARVYDMMLDLATRSEALDLASLENLTQTCYVLAGVFMLFRTVIGLIQMLVNPDKMNDSNVGAGKLISRIVISIVLLLVLQPQGILFKSCEGDTCNEGGLAPRIERALLDDEDGLIVRLIELGGGVKITKDNNSQTIDSGIMTKSFSDIGGYLVEDVYAATGDLSCYYFGVSKHMQEVTQIGPHANTTQEITINKVYKIDFFKSKKNANQTVGTAYPIGNTPYYFKVRSGTTIAGNASYGKYSALKRNVMTAGMFSDGFPSKCPEYIKLNDSGKSYSPQEDMPYGDIKSCTGFFNVNPGRRSCPNTGILGGYSSYQEFKAALDSMKNDREMGITGIGDAKYFVGEGKKLYGANDEDRVVESNTEFLSGVSSGAIGFAQASAASFHTCADGATEECKEAQGKMFTSSKGNDELEQLIDDDKLDIGFIISMVVGIALVVYLLILCVDVIVRRLKLTLLQVMAPLPAISYIDPNDKVFGQWGKMYIATYLDLFIKLIAISLALGLLQGLINNDEFSDNLLYRFFYIVAILIFAKLVPSMISKIFGLDSMGGSFKDILGMGKAAAGFGAGAVLGAAAGVATGKGFGRLSGIAKGAMMGAGSGAKGNILGGAQGISSRNAKVNQQKADGLNFWQRAAVGAGGMTGITPGAKAANQMEKANQAYEAQSKFKNHMLDEVKKKNANFNVGAINRGQNIIRKGGDSSKAADVVARTGEDIDMKNEYAKQANLSNLSQEQWFNMTNEQKEASFGRDAIYNSDGELRSLTEAQIFQNNRVAALEDYAIAKMASDLSNDAETVKEYNAFKDAVTQAQKSGVEMSDLPELNKFNNKTVSNAKDQALQGYNKAASSSSVKIQKHIDSK